MNGYEFCILDDEKDIIDYERELYKIDSMSWGLNSNKKISSIFDERLFAEVPYESLIHYCIKKDNKIICGVRANLNPQKQSQLKIVGFDVQDVFHHENSCEGLNFFVNVDYAHAGLFKVFSNLITHIFKDLRVNHGKREFYSYCEGNLLALYQLFEGNVLDTLKTGTEEVYLLKFKL